MLDITESLIAIKEMYNEIYVIVAPPRTSSTAFSRTLWNHQLVDLYSHEPFDRVYHQQEGLMSTIEELNHPIRLNSSQNKPSKKKYGDQRDDFPSRKIFSTSGLTYDASGYFFNKGP